ncbi:M20/M25/M40 family metallo-hydrolase [Hominibacterium faecale]|uniref:M20/M25/M40 family metallo-hydrolase n=1 Tax=Hominibacterium faecale TaxID=2839743 RepID=UPI0022B2A291|nr:M20/M25/M40 family metallo-hydrolase [Hominibacterium faecale]
MNSDWKKEKINITFSKEVIEELSRITDCSKIGGRWAGSPAEHEAADYLVKKFNEAGLVRVTKDPFPVDAWTLKETSLTYTEESGEKQEVSMGGYACHAVFEKKKVSMIFAGKGTEQDYEQVDPKGKLVLIEINQADDWWINFPAYEAKLRGALGVICINTGGFGQEGDNVLVSEDLCGPADLLAFSIGKKDGFRLKQQIAASSTKEISVVLNVDSRVEEGGISYNIWGDIPGETEDVIYIINHYDSYYYTVFDDVQGIGWALGLAKAFTEKGVRPKKTLRFVAHGAEEWGLMDSKYDWAIGAYRQITDIRPEWKETGFAVVNLDGFYAVKGERKFCIVCTQELYDFVQEAVNAYGNTGEYQIETNMKLTSSTEDFSYTKAGIPSFVAGAYDGCLADRKVLHSSDSSWEAGFDDQAFELFHNLFAHIIAHLDAKAICPINLQRRLGGIYEELAPVLKESDVQIFKKAVREAVLLKEHVADFNEGCLAEGRIPADKGALNQELHKIYQFIHQHFIRLNWNDEMIAPHQRYAANVEALEKAVACSEKGQYSSAADHLMEIDFNYYAPFFSRDTYDYFVKQVTEEPKDSWGTGLIENGNEDLYAVIRSLLENKYGYQERERLEQALDRQQRCYNQAVLKETEAAEKAEKAIKLLNNKF